MSTSNVIFAVEFVLHEVEARRERRLSPLDEDTELAHMIVKKPNSRVRRPRNRQQRKHCHAGPFALLHERKAKSTPVFAVQVKHPGHKDSSTGLELMFARALIAFVLDLIGGVDAKLVPQVRREIEAGFKIVRVVGHCSSRDTAPMKPKVSPLLSSEVVLRKAASQTAVSLRSNSRSLEAAARAFAITGAHIRNSSSEPGPCEFFHLWSTWDASAGAKTCKLLRPPQSKIKRAMAGFDATRYSALTSLLHIRKI